MSRRQVLELGVMGKVPIDALFELYLETKAGDILTFHQTRCSASIGGWVYDAAACLAKYLETDHFRRRISGNGGRSCSFSGAANENPLEVSSAHPLSGRTVVELGAGTGIVGILTSYYGSHSIITDLDSLVPLIRHNIKQNSAILKGTAVGEALCWGATIPSSISTPDYLVLANCVYYESSFEPLLQTVLELTNSSTLVLACYEERTPEIRRLIARWHDLAQRHFVLEEVDSKQLDNVFWKEYVRVVLMTRK